MFIAGRIEFLGKHTDYCGGRSIVCAIDRGFYVSFAPSKSGQINIKNEDSGEQISFEFSDKIELQRGHWANYPKTVVKRISENFKSKKLRGAGISFRSDLPQAAGLSSSSAFMIAIFSAISKICDLPEFDEFQENISSENDLAEYLGCIENGFSFRNLRGSAGVGTFGGSQDHTAILNSKKDHLSQFSFSPVVREKDIFLPENYAFVIASSGVAAEKTGAAMEKYNRVSKMVSEIVEKWRGEEKNLAQIIENAGFESLLKFIENGEFSFPKRDLLNRVRQFYEESFEIIPNVLRFLEDEKVEKIGELIDRSQKNAEILLGNQVAETVFLQQIAREIGAFASSAFGAGFGGSVYALVNKSDAENFLDEWREVYLRQFPEHLEKAEFFITKASASKI